MLQNSARQLGVTNSIAFTGKVSHNDLPDYISLGEIFAMPVRSRFFGLEVEGLGIVYLEASACGLPVIAGNFGVKWRKVKTITPDSKNVAASIPKVIAAPYISIKNPAEAAPNCPRSLR